jgi:hypothetical protein
MGWVLCSLTHDRQKKRMEIQKKKEKENLSALPLL